MFHYFKWFTFETFFFKKFWSYSVVVITFGFDPDNPGSNPGRTSFFAKVTSTLYFLHLLIVKNSLVRVSWKAISESHKSISTWTCTHLVA